MGSSGEVNAVSKGEAMSPAAQLFHAPTLNCYVIASIGSKTRINPHVIKEGLRQTLLKHPRFTSKLERSVNLSQVMKGRTPWWIPTTVEIDKHVIVPEIDPHLDFPDRFVEDYTSNLTKTPLDSSRPLWELHLLNIKTCNSEGLGVFRIHHSLGDGASLISLLLSATRKSSDPQSLPTLPTKKRAVSRPSFSPSSSFCSLFLAIFSGLTLIWNTLMDMVMFFATILFLRDSQTPLKDVPGVEHSTKRFVYRNVSLDDIKLVKSAMKVTINDVLLGVTQAGLARYLNRIKATSIIDRKKHSFEAICTFGCAKLSLKLFGMKALTIHFLSYVNRMTISMAVEPSVIPDPHLLCDDVEASLKQVTAVVKKTLIPDVV